MTADNSWLAENWAQIRRRVDVACHEAGRDPAEVAILPVSKTFGPELIRAGVALGMRRFGENKVQEIRDKFAPLEDCGIPTRPRTWPGWPVRCSRWIDWSWPRCWIDGCSMKVVRSTCWCR